MPYTELRIHNTEYIIHSKTKCIDKWRKQGFNRFHSHENRIRYIFFPLINLISSLHHVSRVGMTKFGFRNGLLM